MNELTQIERAAHKKESETRFEIGNGRENYERYLLIDYCLNLF